MNVVGSLKSWVRTNITGSEDQAKYSKAASTPVDAEYSRIQDRVDGLGEKLASLDKDTQLGEVTLRNFKDSELVVGGAAVGGVVGGTAGVLTSLSSSLAGGAEVVVHDRVINVQNEVWKGVIKNPVIAVTQNVPVLNNNGQQIGTTTETTGYKQTYSPDIEKKDVGHYTERTHEIKGGSSGSPLVSGLIGLGAGMAVGAAIGGLVAVGRRAVGMGYDNHERVPVKNEGKKLIQFGIAGGAVGAAVGAVNGYVEGQNAINTSYKTEVPKMEHVVLGQLPKEWVRDALNPNGKPPSGTVPYEVNQYKTEFSLTSNKLDVDKKTVEVHQAGRYGVVGGLVGGAVVGTIGGVLSGVAINVIRRAV